MTNFDIIYYDYPQCVLLCRQAQNVGSIFAVLQRLHPVRGAMWWWDAFSTNITSLTGHIADNHLIYF
jgi:hypothetical protein